MTYFTYYFSLLSLELILSVSDFFISFHQLFFPLHKSLSKSHSALQAEWNPKSHCSPLLKMTAGASGSTWNDSQKDEIIRIAECAIETRTQFSNVVRRSSPALVPTPCNSSSSCSENAVDELLITADFQLHVQVQGQYILRRILLSVPLVDHVSH